MFSGQKLRSYRESSGISIRALARLSGLSPATISLIERGQRQPSVKTATRLAKWLRIPLVLLVVEDQRDAS